jgi:hypothetical protein
VRDQHDGRAVRGRGGEQDLDHRVGARAVEAAGRFVGQDDGRRA